MYFMITQHDEESFWTLFKNVETLLRENLTTFKTSYDTNASNITIEDLAQGKSQAGLPEFMRRIISQWIILDKMGNFCKLICRNNERPRQLRALHSKVKSIINNFSPQLTCHITKTFFNNDLLGDVNLRLQQETLDLTQNKTQQEKILKHILYLRK